MCPHVGCQHSFLRQGVLPCPECESGIVVLDPLSAPKWRLDCSKCSLLIYLPEKLHAAKLSREVCKVSCLIRVEKEDMLCIRATTRWPLSCPNGMLLCTCLYDIHTAVKVQDLGHKFDCLLLTFP